MKRINTFLLCAAASALFQMATAPGAFALPIFGANLATFAVLGATTVTNEPSGATTIFGDLGVWAPAGANDVTGEITITINGSNADSSPGSDDVHQGSGTFDVHGDQLAELAQSELTTAYNELAGLTGAIDLTSQDLGDYDFANPLAPGVYKFTSTAGLTGDLWLDSTVPDAFWVFQMTADLITATGSSVNFIGGPAPVFWQVGSSATIQAGTSFQGNLVVLTSISLVDGATLGCGGAYARNGQVSMDTNTITRGCANIEIVPDDEDEDEDDEVNVVPEPGTLLLMGTGIVGLVARRRRSARG